MQACYRKYREIDGKLEVSHPEVVEIRDENIYKRRAFIARRSSSCLKIECKNASQE